jgi:hypothetical protein
MKQAQCNHNWIEDYDPKAAQDAYNDGVNYLPADYICTHCKRRKKIKYRRDTVDVDFIAALGVLAAFLFIVFYPFVIPIVELYKALFSKDKRSN